MELVNPLDQLTTRERECLALVSRNLNSKEIGRILGIESSTVDVTLKRAARKTGIRGRAQLARLMRDNEPELTQSLLQRLGQSSFSVAERPFTPPPEPVEPATPDRQWGDLPPWQKRLFAAAIALGVLGLAAALVAIGRHVLGGVAKIH